MHPISIFKIEDAPVEERKRPKKDNYQSSTALHGVTVCQLTIPLVSQTPSSIDLQLHVTGDANSRGASLRSHRPRNGSCRIPVIISAFPLGPVRPNSHSPKVFIISHTKHFLSLRHTHTLSLSLSLSLSKFSPFSDSFYLSAFSHSFSFPRKVFLKVLMSVCVLSLYFSFPQTFS